MRRLALSLAGIPLVALAGYTGYWFYLAGALRAGIEPWAAERRAEGYDLHWQSATLDGFPLSFRLRFDGVTLQASRPEPFAAKAAAIILTAQPWAPRHWHGEASQGVSIGRPDGSATLQLATLGGTATIMPKGATTVNLDATGISAAGLFEGFGAATAHGHLDLPERAAESHLDMAQTATLAFGQLSLPWAPPPFPRQIDQLSVTASLKGRIPHGPLPQALDTWRSDGGTLDIDAARIAWGTTKMSLTGTLALDAALQPIGALTATIEGQNEVVDALVAGGGLKPRYAGIAKTVLGLLAKPTGPNGEKKLQVPMTLQDGSVFLGPVQITALPHLTWR